MMNKKSKGFAFAEILASKNLTSRQLFECLHKAIGDENNLKEMRLPTNSAVVSLESCKIKCQIKAFEPRIMSAYRQMEQAAKTEKEQKIREALNIMDCKPRDYAIMAMDKYLKMDENHTIEGFYTNYNSFLKEKEHPLDLNKMMLKNMETYLQKP